MTVAQEVFCYVGLHPILELSPQILVGAIIGAVSIAAMSSILSSVLFGAEPESSRYLLGPKQRLARLSSTPAPDPDVLHEWRDSAWRMMVSAYPKLRLSPVWVIETMEKNGFSVECSEGSPGMVCLVARRP